VSHAGMDILGDCVGARNKSNGCEYAGCLGGQVHLGGVGGPRVVDVLSVASFGSDNSVKADGQGEWLVWWWDHRLHDEQGRLGIKVGLSC
jgi:hypothetical protein